MIRLQGHTGKETNNNKKGTAWKSFVPARPVLDNKHMFEGASEKGQAGGEFQCTNRQHGDPI